jgi:hypothetical protein
MLTFSTISVHQCRISLQQGSQSITVPRLSRCAGAFLKGNLVQVLCKRCSDGTAVTAAGITPSDPWHARKRQRIALLYDLNFIVYYSGIQSIT